MHQVDKEKEVVVRVTITPTYAPSGVPPAKDGV